MAERKYLRVSDVSFTVYWRYWRPHGSKLPFEKAEGMDIGEGGLLLVVTDQPLTLKQGLELQIEIPPTPVEDNREPIQACAEAVWGKPTTTVPPRYHHGLSFTRIAQADFSRLESYILLTKWMQGERA